MMKATSSALRSCWWFCGIVRCFFCPKMPFDKPSDGVITKVGIMFTARRGWSVSREPQPSILQPHLSFTSTISIWIWFRRQPRRRGPQICVRTSHCGLLYQDEIIMDWSVNIVCSLYDNLALHWKSMGSKVFLEWTDNKNIQWNLSINAAKGHVTTWLIFASEYG